MFIDIHGVRFNTVSFGHGPRTFVAHGGWTGSWELWLQPFELMHERWRCLSYDHRGAGQTNVDPATITPARLVDDLFAFLDRFEVRRCVLAGESMGGLVALLAAARDPARFEGLVLVDPAIGSGDEASWLIDGSRSDYPATVARFVKLAVPEQDADHLRRWGRDILLRAEPEAAARLLEGWGEVAIDPAAITVPTLVIQGELDVIAPLDRVRRLAGALGAQLHVMEGTGHVPTVTRPAEVAAVIDEWAAGLPSD